MNICFVHIQSEIDAMHQVCQISKEELDQRFKIKPGNHKAIYLNEICWEAGWAVAIVEG